MCRAEKYDKIELEKVWENIEQMQEIKVSVIIPVFNAEKQMLPCVESLLIQTLPELELIFVDDCSTDQTGKMLSLIRDYDCDRIKVITCDKNLGAGGARNLGIQVARGEYLGFVDIDDVVTKDMFEKLYFEAKQGDYDVVDCGFYFEAQDLAILYTSDELKGVVNNHQRSELIASGGYLWSKLYKRSFWLENKFEFRPNVILEDSEIIAKIYATMGTIGNVKETLYHYKNTEKSLSKETNTERYYESSFAAMKALYQELAGLKNYEGIREAVEYEILQLYACAIVCVLQSAKRKEALNHFKMLSDLQEFRTKCITEGYQNHYVEMKMAKEDIEFMKLCDKNPKLLLDKIDES